MAPRDNRVRSWRRILVLLLVVAFLSCAAPCQAAGGTGSVVAARVTRVVDGDTIEVRYSGKEVRVRLWGIDTPEWEQPHSREARDFTRRHLAGRRVDLEVRTRDSHGRLVAMVMVDGRSFNEELVRQGWAWVHIHYCKEPVCRKWRRLEKEARDAGRGLWRQSHPVPPWQWKQRHHR